MNWIERLYEIKGKDLYSQNGEGLILESILLNVDKEMSLYKRCVDIGCGPDTMYLSNTRHMKLWGWKVKYIDKEIGITIDLDNCIELTNLDAFDRQNKYPERYDFISIDIDGNDYWILDKMMPYYHTPVIIAEFNAMYTDSRTIAYNPDHVWAGDSYYGFTFEAGKKLAEKHGYKVIFQVADMNMIMVRADLVEGLHIPEVTYKQNDFFKLSERTDWIFV